SFDRRGLFGLSYLRGRRQRLRRRGRRHNFRRRGRGRRPLPNLLAACGGLEGEEDDEENVERPDPLHSTPELRCACSATARSPTRFRPADECGERIIKAPRRSRVSNRQRPSVILVTLDVRTLAP